MVEIKDGWEKDTEEPSILERVMAKAQRDSGAEKGGEGGFRGMPPPAGKSSGLVAVRELKFKPAVLKNVKGKDKVRLYDPLIDFHSVCSEEHERKGPGEAVRPAH